MQDLSEAVCTATDLRARIRRHPWSAVGIGALLGYFGWPTLLRASRHALPIAKSAMGAMGAAQPANGARDLRGLILASLPGMRAR